MEYVAHIYNIIPNTNNRPFPCDTMLTPGIAHYVNIPYSRVGRILVNTTHKVPMFQLAGMLVSLKKVCTFRSSEVCFRESKELKERLSILLMGQVHAYDIVLDLGFKLDKINT